MIGDQFACVTVANAKFWDIAEEGLTQSFSIDMPPPGISPIVDVFNNFKIFSSWGLQQYDHTIQVYDDNGNLVNVTTLSNENDTNYFSFAVKEGMMAIFHGSNVSMMNLSTFVLD